LKTKLQSKLAASGQIIRGVIVMTGLDALHSVQFVTQKGKRLAILSADDWKALIEWLETLEDVQIARQAFAKLKAAKGDRRRARWREWRLG
jgi:PHD/YefM family antitoxin component YafN of YafNO toxin-antitoxin module